MPALERARLAVLVALAATTAANGAFLLADPRLGHLPLWLAFVFLVGGAAYLVAIPLCARRRREGFVLAACLGVAGAALAAADNLGLSGSAPNAETFALNGAAVILAVPMVVGSLVWLRSRGQAASMSAAGGGP